MNKLLLALSTAFLFQIARPSAQEHFLAALWGQQPQGPEQRNNGNIEPRNNPPQANPSVSIVIETNPRITIKCDNQVKRSVSELMTQCCLLSSAYSACQVAAQNPASCCCCPALTCAACLTISPYLLKNRKIKRNIHVYTRAYTSGPVKEIMNALLDEHQD